MKQLMYPKNKKELDPKKRAIILILLGLLGILILIIVLIYNIAAPNTPASQNIKTTPSPTPVPTTLANGSENGTIFPYNDPAGRFYINYMTPYVSSEIAVVFKDEKSYDESKADADAFITEVKKTMKITSVYYVKGN